MRSSRKEPNFKLPERIHPTILLTALTLLLAGPAGIIDLSYGNSDYRVEVPLSTDFGVSLLGNPFTEGTEIRLSLTEATEYEVLIHDATGRLVRTFSDVGEAGTVTLCWDGSDTEGHPVSPGVYFYRASAGPHRVIGKMTLLR